MSTANKVCYFCKSEIPEDAKECPYCPTTFDQPEEQEDSGLNKRDILINIGFLLALVAVAGMTAYSIRSRRLGEERDKARLIELAEAEARRVVARIAAEEALPEMPASPVKDHRLEGAQTIYMDQRLDKAIREASKKPQYADWTLEGHLYDLVTLKPLAGATIQFVDVDQGKEFESGTQKDGFYRSLVPHKQVRGYVMIVNDERYHRAYHSSLFKPDPKSMSPAARRTFAVTLMKGVHVPANVIAEGSRLIKTDYYLIPADLKP